MDAVLCLREATHSQSMELERPEAICGLESGTRSRLWSTRGGCSSRQEVAFFGLRIGRDRDCLSEPIQFSIFLAPDLSDRGDHTLSSSQTRAGHFCRRTWAFAQNPHKIIDVRCERSLRTENWFTPASPPSPDCAACPHRVRAWPRHSKRTVAGEQSPESARAVLARRG
jgi:hypothetical protein